MVVCWKLLMLLSFVCLALFANVVVADDPPENEPPPELDDPPENEPLPELDDPEKRPDFEDNITMVLPNRTHADSFDNQVLKDYIKLADISIKNLVPGKLPDDLFDYNATNIAEISKKLSERHKAHFSDGKFTPYLRCCGNGILVLLVVYIISCAVIMLVASLQLKSSVDKVPDVMKDVVGDVKHYIGYHTKYLNVNVQHEITSLVREIHKDAESNVIKEANTVNENLLLDVIQKLKTGDDKVKLTRGLEKVKNEIHSKMNNFLDNFNTNELDNKFQVSDLEAKINNFKDLKLNLMSDHSGKVDDVIHQINFNMQNMVDMINGLNSVLTPVEKYADKKIESNGYDTESYTVLCAAIVILLTTFCYIVALVFGICAKRPNYKNVGFCVKPNGKRVLSVATSSTTSVFPTAAICCFMLHSAATMREYGCDPLRNPLDRPDIIGIVDGILKHRMVEFLPSEFRMPTIVKVLDGCARNLTFCSWI